MTRFSLLLVLALFACSKKKEAAPATTADKKVEAPTAPVGPAAPWTFDPAAIQAKLQGAWVMFDQGYLGSHEAWEVKGDQVKMWDAKANTEKIGTLKVEAPCQLTVTVKSGSGSEGTTSHFVLDGDTLHMGLGDAGVKQGDKIVACMSNGVFVLEGTKCEFFASMFGRWDQSAATCSFDGTKLKVSGAAFRYDGEMPVRGNVFASDQLWANTPTKVASYDEAKAQAQANLKP